MADHQAINKPLQIERVLISSLSADPANVRKHDEKNLQAIMGSLRAFNQQKPIVVNERGIVLAGNGTLAAAKALGWTHIDIVRTDLKGTEAIAYAIADNRSGELADWDQKLLGVTLSSIADDGFDISSIGFDTDDLNDILPKPEFTGETDPDDVPEVPQNIHNVQRGDIWQLGNHRLVCGDSTDKADVEKLMNGQKADMVFTDPPYGIDVPCDRVEQVKTFASQGLAKKGVYKQIEGDQSTETAMSAIALLGAPCEIYWGGNYYNLPPSPCWIVWDKRVEENQTDINSDCELAWVKHKHKASVRIFRHLWKGMIKASEQNEKRCHPTQKPIALAEWCFENYGDPKIVIDVFLGSGSTLIACEKTGRKCFGMEIDEHYCSVIIERWQKFTGKTAVKLESNNA